MDGFHLDNAILAERGQLPVKGAPQTFDADGFVSLLQRLAEPTDKPVYVPVFDRAADLARNAAQCVDKSHRVIIVEGNYLLLDRDGWNTLPAIFHLSIMLDVPLATLEERLVQRWLDHGLTQEQARLRALDNDIPNARLVLQESKPADLTFESVRQ
jgi:pantothenate kinase